LGRQISLNYILPNSPNNIRAVFLYLSNEYYTRATNLVATTIIVRSHRCYNRFIVRLPGGQKHYLELALRYHQCCYLHLYFLGKKPESEEKTPVMRIKKTEVVLSVIAIIIFTFLLGTFLLNHTSASFPFVDSFCTACSLVAQVLLARKVLENWLIWIFVDIIYVGVYIFKDLHLTAVMYAIYVGIALMGYIDWKRDWKKQVM
jgi:nicotinamide mononucleotide transporter PnuC